MEGDEVELGSLQLPNGYAEIAAPVRIGARLSDSRPLPAHIVIAGLSTMTRP